MRLNYLGKSALLLSAAATGIFAAPAAQAVNFNFSYDENVSYNQRFEIEKAGHIWSSYLTDDVTVNIGIGRTSLASSGTLGRAAPGIKEEKLEEYAKSLIADLASKEIADLEKIKDSKSLKKSKEAKESLKDVIESLEKITDSGSIDRSLHNAISALESLTTSRDRKLSRYKKDLEKTIESLKAVKYSNSWQAAKTLEDPFSKDSFKEYRVMKDGYIDREEKLYITRANSKAIGLEDAHSEDLDGYIQLDYLLGQNHDLASVVLHEIGHSLGFISGVDGLKNATTLDLFRYSDNSLRQNAIDFNQGSEAFLSFDGTRTDMRFSGDHGHEHHEGCSHWHQDDESGIMAGNLKKGEQLEISMSDLKALDIIGWDVDYQAKIDQRSIEKKAGKSLGGNGKKKKKYEHKKADKAMDGDKDEQSDYTMGFSFGRRWGQLDGSATAAAQDVPEPTAVLALFSTALLSLGIRRKRS